MRSTTRKYIGAILLALPLLCSSALADGKVFAQAVVTSVKTPDQRAMLYYSNGLERLVIETSFVGAGTNFAWVVPLPAAPRIEAVSTNFFSYLNLAFQPHLIREAKPWWILFLFAGYVLAISVWAYRQNGPGRLIKWFAFMLLLFISLLMLIPNFVRARGFTSVSTLGGVTILDRQSVGIYNTTTLSGTNGNALLDWLNTHGFAVPKAALPAISSYAAQGWVFVAGTINRAAPAVMGSRPHPLSFTFKTGKAVYPLRLTGVENPRCTIDLFVFGPDKAGVPGFHVDYCGQPSLIQTTNEEDFSMQKELFSAPRPGEFKFGNPEVIRQAFPANVATRLTGTLTAAQMQSDAWINWTAFKPIVPTFHTQDAAIEETINWLLGLSLPGLLLILLLAPRLQRKLIFQCCLMALLIGSAGGFIRYNTIKFVQVTYVHGGWLYTQNNFRQLDAAVNEYALEHTNALPATDGAFLFQLTNVFRFAPKNTFTYQPLRCEPTPGNITLQGSPTTNGLDVLWYDIQGAPHKLITLPAK